MGRAQLIRSRSSWIYAALCLGAAILAGRLAVLQIWDAPKLAALAREQRTRTIDLGTIRGEIVDREGQELAVSVNSWSVYAQPSEFQEPPHAIARQLAPVLGLPVPELERARKHHRPRKDLQRRLREATHARLRAELGVKQ